MTSYSQEHPLGCANPSKRSLWPRKCYNLFTCHIESRGFIGQMGVIRAPYSDHQCPWYHLSGKMNFCVIGIEMGTENALPLSTELPAPPECGQHTWWSRAWTITWPPDRGSQNESGLPPRIWSTVPPTAHQYSQRIEALRTVLKWRHLWLSLSTASAQPSCVY